MPLPEGEVDRETLKVLELPSRTDTVLLDSTMLGRTLSIFCTPTCWVT